MILCDQSTDEAPLLHFGSDRSCPDESAESQDDSVNKSTAGVESSLRSNCGTAVSLCVYSICTGFLLAVIKPGNGNDGGPNLLLPELWVASQCLSLPETYICQLALCLSHQDKNMKKSTCVSCPEPRTVPGTLAV